MDLAVKIVGLYDGDPKAELSIRGIARRLKGTYSFVYGAVEQLAKEGVLSVSVKGRAKMCSLNLSNDRAKALLALHSVSRKEEFLKRNKVAGQLLSEFVKRIAGEDVYCIILFGSYAKGSAAERSDLDIIVVGASRKRLDRRVSAEANTLQARYGKEVNTIVLDRPMFLSSLRSDEVTVVKEAVSCHVVLFGYERFWELVREGLR